MGIKAVKKHKFNAVDAVIIIVIAAVLVAGIVAAVMFYTAGDGAAEIAKEYTIEYILEFRGLRNEYADNFKVGEKVIDSVAKHKLGEVIAVNTVPYTYNGNNFNTGELVVSDYPNHSNVQLTVRANAITNEYGMYYIRSVYRMSVGSTVYVRMPNYTGVAYCVEIKEASEVGA